MRVLAMLLLSALAAGCAAPNDDRHSPLAAAQRVLAIDFGASAFGGRIDGLQRAPLALAAEFRRAADLQHGLPKLQPAMARLEKAQQRLAHGIAAETSRNPVAATAIAKLPQRWTQSLVNALATVPYVLGLHRRPLGECSDQPHRTDPFDQRPEVGWLARIARRLQLTH